MTASAPLRGSVVVLLLAASASQAGEIGQVTLVDESYTHVGWFRHMRFIEQPNDWTFPYDYHKGYTYTRCEVLRFNGEVNTIGLHYCYFQDSHTPDKHACTKMIKVHEPGVYYRRWQNSKMWQVDVIDWSRKLMNFMQIDNAVKGKGRAELKITVIIVADGYKLRPPPDWDCPADWDVDASGTTEILRTTSNEIVKANVRAGNLGAAWAAAERDVGSGDPEKAEQGRRVVEILEKYLKERREVLVGLKAEAPIAAAEGLFELAKMFSSSPKAKEIAAEAAVWNKEQATKRARIARSVFGNLRKKVTLLKRKLGGNKASDPAMQRKLALDIRDVRSMSAGLAKSYPETTYARKAVAYCEEIEVALPAELVEAVRTSRRGGAQAPSETGPGPTSPVPPPSSREAGPPAQESEERDERERRAAAGHVLSDEDRAALETWAADARQRTVARIVEAARGGARLHVYVEFGRGIQKGRVEKADEKGLAVGVTGASFPTTWDRLPPKRFHGLAMQVVGEGPVEALLDLAAMGAQAGLADSVDKALDKLYRMNCPDREKLGLVARAARALRK